MTMLNFDEPLLTGADEVALAKAIEVGVLAGHALEAVPDGADDDRAADLAALARRGEQAFRRFVGANLRLVTLVVAGTGARCRLDPEELFQEGVVGLLEAARRYDHARGARFATFALPWIRMRVGEWAATRGGTLGLPARRAKTWLQVHGVEDALALRQGRRPSVDEVAAEAGLPPAVVRELLTFRPAMRAEADTLAAVPAHAAPAGGDVLAVRRLVGRLPREEAEVIARRYGLEGRGSASVEQVADALGISESTVRRRERTALARIRDGWPGWAAA